MRLELALSRRPPLTERIAGPWRMPLLRLTLAFAAVLLLFAPTWADMAGQWWESSTYNHILLVPVILAWLVAMRTNELAWLKPSAWWPGLVWCGGALLCWLIGDVSGVATASHLGMVMLLQGLVLALLGPRVAAALLFPLFYAFFLVPVGDEIVPALQTVTANQVIALTHWSGIPAGINGVFIDTPAGLFEVAEACSGVKFLVAMIALGSLVAHLCYRSWIRRALFMGFAIVLPILANGVRAWATIYIAQSQGIAFAQGFDHIFYGWIFFAIVTGILLAAGWRFFDRSADDRFVDVEAIEASPLLRRTQALAIGPWKAFALVIALVVAVLGWSGAAGSTSAAVPQRIDLPQVQGWELVDYEPAAWWEPRASGADHRLLGRYRDMEGRTVDVFYALYSSQGEGREAGAFGEGALVPDSEWRWAHAGPNFGSVPSDVLQGDNQRQRLAVTFYRHGPMFGGSRVKLKLASLLDRIRLKARPTSILIVSSEDPDPVGAVGRFVDAIAPVDTWMDRIAQKP